MDIKEQMTIISRSMEFKNDHERDCYLGEEVRSYLTPDRFIKDGICMCAAFTTCMNFLGYGFGNIEKYPNPGSSRFSDFGNYAYKVFGEEAYDGHFDIEPNHLETNGQYKSRVSKFISENIKENAAALICVNNGCHWIAALKFYGRIWFIDPLLGYGFNFYNTDLYLRAIEVEMTDVVDEFDAIGAIFLQKRYFEEESKANWWCNALTSDECEETRRPKYKNRSRYFDQHAEIGHYKNFISAMK
jgi:hypothetical protein